MNRAAQPASYELADAAVPGAFRDGELLRMSLPPPGTPPPFPAPAADNLPAAVAFYLQAAEANITATEIDQWLAACEQQGIYEGMADGLALVWTELQGTSGRLAQRAETISRRRLLTTGHRREIARQMAISVSAWAHWVTITEAKAEGLTERQLAQPGELHGRITRLWQDDARHTAALRDAYLQAIRQQARLTLLKIMSDAPTAEMEAFQADVWRILDKVLVVDQRTAGLEAGPDVLRLPLALPQQTSPEVKATAIGLADGPKLRGWKSIEGELALRHIVKGSTIETKLVGHPLLDWLGMPLTVESLRAELRQAGLPATLLLLVVLGAALDKAMRHRLYVTVAIDDLIEAIGWDPRSRAERESMRRMVWRWFALFDAMKVIGRRSGKYRDPDTREIIDLTSDDALIRITGRQLPKQLAFDDSTPPLTITYIAGPWLEQWKSNHQVLTYFGNVRRLAKIPARRPSGAWAHAVGLALHQRWRECSASADVSRVGEQNNLSVRMQPFTRRELLDMFPPNPTAEDILGSANPKRAQIYWREAITQLKRAKIIGHYKELNAPPKERKGWGEAWLAQTLDVRPGEEGRQAIAQIAQRARRVKRPRGQKKAAAAP